MTVLVYVFCQVVRCFVTALQFAMIIRAVFSWFMPDDSHPLMKFLLSVTEPVIFPVRVILDRFESLQRIPIDISFFVTYILLSLIQMAVPYVHL